MKSAMVALYILLSQTSIFLLDSIKLDVFSPIFYFFPIYNLNLFIFTYISLAVSMRINSSANIFMCIF